LRQEVFLTLSRELETARLEEVNSTPLITQIDTAIAPVRPARPSHIVWMIVAFLVGSLLAFTLTLVTEHVARARTDGAHDYLEFKSLVVPLKRFVGR